ncbi:AAA family ATPase [Chamaesiphon sp. GL140_3_metabinner_50]|uniref:AAA family ATPase n=1 Tax=Chamaesiphon sp. GL140_3_metabinner_50 TaxID=2970812 RepID=UPI0025CEDAD3|nr:AAA family ATPase [Chamaesiphon sp. GL140_3_metabinner_50]
MEVDFQQIEARKKILENTRSELKNHFVGIDETIDDLLDYIQIWYLMPEILSRPITVNLWGMTGVGKTDLVRRLVKCLNFQDRFIEIELSHTEGSSWDSSVGSALNRNGISDGKPAIVLFDEIQRFNTLNPDGSAVQSSRFTDFWELLSDGKLSKRVKDDLDYYIQDYLYQQKNIKKRKERGEEDVDKNPTMGFYEAKNLKSMLQLDGDISDIAEMSQMQMVEQIRQAKQKKKVYEPIDRSKTLIIISGNLDEAFSMATQIAESDVDADIFHAFTKKITLVDIKNALSKSFRPEQVARFGNIHLIYASLKKCDFEQLIEHEIDRIIKITKEKFDISVKVDRSIHKLVYRNGVFPVQGVRPVFSSLVDILETNLSKFLFTALLRSEKYIDINYDFVKSQINAQIGYQLEEIPFVGRIDKIRESNLRETIVNISVHESGHAVAYMVLFGLAPLQLKSKLASSYAGGFTFPHQIYETKENLIKQIKIYLAGGLAEEIIFGDKLASVGRIHDREQATKIAIDYIRRYGFDEGFQANYTLEYGHSMDMKATDLDVEKMVVRMASATRELLSAHRSLLQQLSWQLAATGSLAATEVSAIGLKYGVPVIVEAEGFLMIPAYNQLLTEPEH